MKKFYEIEFELPNKYIVLDNKTIQQLLIEENRGKFNDYVLEYLKAQEETDTLIIICDPNKFDPLAMYLREYIKLSIVHNHPKPSSNVSNEEWLANMKKVEEETFLLSYKTPLEFNKFELSEIPQNVERSYYSEAKGLLEGTLNYQYSFYVDKNYYVLTLDCFENEKIESFNIFNQLVNSIKV
jgi:hypothetical protein